MRHQKYSENAPPARALRRGADELPTLPQLEMTAAIVPGGAQALWRRLDDAGSRRVDPGCIGRGRDGTGADPLDVMRMLRASPEALGTSGEAAATAGGEWIESSRFSRGGSPSTNVEYKREEIKQYGRQVSKDAARSKRGVEGKQNVQETFCFYFLWSFNI